MNHLVTLLFISCGLCTAQTQERKEQESRFSGLPATNTPLTELVKGAFINSWPVINRPELQHLKSKYLKDANFQDTDDCAKKLLCELSRKKDLTWDEDLLHNYYDKPVNYMSDSLFFNIAVQVGKDGERDCQEVYPSCYLELPEMLKIIRRQGMSFELPGEELDCQVYALWRKKDKNADHSKMPINADNKIETLLTTNVFPNDKESMENQQEKKRIIETKSKSLLTNEIEATTFQFNLKEESTVTPSKNIETVRTKAETIQKKGTETTDRSLKFEAETKLTDKSITKNEVIENKKERVLISETKIHSKETKLNYKRISTEVSSNENPEEILTIETDTLASPPKLETKEESSENTIKTEERKDTIGGVIDTWVEFAKTKSKELLTIEKETTDSAPTVEDEEDSTDQTSVFREGALGGVIGGVIGGLLGVYRSFI